MGTDVARLESALSSGRRSTAAVGPQRRGRSASASSVTEHYGPAAHRSSTRRCDRRLENASQTTNKIHETARQRLDEADDEMLSARKTRPVVEQALRHRSKARGGFGRDATRDTVLRDPPAAFRRTRCSTNTSASGERVDATRASRPDDPRRREVPTRQLQPLSRRRRQTTSRRAQRLAVRPRCQDHIAAIAAKYYSRQYECTQTSPSCTCPVEGLYYELRSARPERCSRTRTSGASSRFRRRRSRCLQVIALGWREDRSRSMRTR